MEVKLLYPLLGHDVLNILYSACRQCYYSGYVGDKFPFNDVSYEKKAELIERVTKSGHHSVLEHVAFTFAIKDLSRVAQQQLTRHRLGVSYSIQSMRYCLVDDMGYYTPDSIKKNSEILDEYNEIINRAVEFYQKNTEDNSVPREDARGILPLNWNSNIVMTMNCRELLHFFNERLCTNAQKEIRELAQKMLFLCNEILPEVFSAAGPKCKTLGYCNEGKRSCHKYPLREDVFKIYNQFKDFKEEK